MTLEEIITDFRKLKNLLMNLDNEFAKQCTSFIDYELIYSTEPKFQIIDGIAYNHKYKLPYDTSNLTDGLFYRNIRLYFKGDIGFELICDDEFTTLSKISCFQLMEYQKKICLSCDNPFDPKFQEYNDKVEFSLRFSNGLLSNEVKTYEQIDFSKYENKKSELFGVWKNQEFYIDLNHKSIISSNKNFDYKTGFWTVINDIIIIDYKHLGSLGDRQYNTTFDKNIFKFSIKENELTLINFSTCDKFSYKLLKSNKDNLTEFERKMEDYPEEMWFLFKNKDKKN
jgi:hypothetical protein